MSISIDSVTIGSIVDRRLVLSNAQMARKIAVLNNWNVIRLGCRVAWDDSGANVTGLPRFYLGMLSNPDATLSNGPLGSTTSHFVGYRTDFHTWNRNTSPSRYQTFTGENYLKKVGSTVTSGNQLSLSQYFSATPSTIRMAFVVQITKGSPNFNIKVIIQSNPTVSDVSYATLLASLEAETFATAGTPLGGDYAGADQTGVNIAVSELTDGPLNAICCGWDRTAPAVHVSELLFRVIS